MSSRKLPPIATALIQAKRRIQDERNWTKFALVFDGRMCALGALGVTMLEWQYKPCAGVTQLADAARTLYPTISYQGDFAVITTINDHLGFAAVHNIYDFAIARAMAEIFRKDAAKRECFSCGERHPMTDDNIIKFYEGGYSEEYFCDQCIIAGRHTKLGGY